MLVQAADAITGSRPGARREAFETYVKRLEGLEKIASSYKGVDRVFAIQAGREIRVIVNPEEVDDARMKSLTEEIARRIETELQYPGPDQSGRDPRKESDGHCPLRSSTARPSRSRSARKSRLRRARSLRAE